MSSKFEQIMEAIKACLQGTGYTVERNLDVPMELNEGSLLIVRDGTEMDQERPLGFTATSHYHKAEVVIVQASADPDDRDQEFDEACLYVQDKVMIDPTFGGLVDSLSFNKPDGMTDSSEGTGGVKAGVIDLEFFYHTVSYF